MFRVCCIQGFVKGGEFCRLFIDLLNNNNGQVLYFFNPPLKVWASIVKKPDINMPMPTTQTSSVGFIHNLNLYSYSNQVSNSQWLWIMLKKQISKINSFKQRNQYINSSLRYTKYLDKLSSLIVINQFAFPDIKVIHLQFHRLQNKK